MERQGRRHGPRADDEDPAPPDLVRDRAGEDGEDAHHQGVGGHQRAQHRVGDAQLLPDLGEDGGDDHDLAGGAEDQQPEGEDDEVG